jgi:prophage regulatory protein
MFEQVLLRRCEVEKITALSRSTIYARMESGTFPKPVSIGPNAVRWYVSDITSWMDECRVNDPNYEPWDSGEGSVA